VLCTAGCRIAPPITLTAQASPPAVFQGEPVTVTVTAGTVSTKKKVSVIYNWSGDGVTGNGTTAEVATGSLAPGTHTVKAEVKEGKRGKEGRKPGQVADASATFMVRPLEPPTISCSASPSTINPGDKSTVTATGVSPQNRPLTYSYSIAPGTGNISSSGATAEFSSAGAPAGVVAIACNVSDDKGQTATGGASVTITKPYVRSIRHVSPLNMLNFDWDSTSPHRNSGARALLKIFADELQRDPDAKAVIVGDSLLTELSKGRGGHGKIGDLAGQRAVDVKDYLTKEEHIEASRIEVRIRSASDRVNGQMVEDYLVPGGANFEADVPGTTPVDESAIKPESPNPIATEQEETPEVNLRVNSAQAGAQAQTANPAAVCTGFVILAYPSYVDLTKPGSILYFELYVVHGGIRPQVLTSLCKALPPGKTCIGADQWAAQTGGCAEHDPVEIAVLDDKRKVLAKVWPLSQEIPNSLNASLFPHFPIDVTPNGFVDNEDSFAKFIWKAEVSKSKPDGQLNENLDVYVLNDQKKSVFNSGTRTVVDLALDQGGPIHQQSDKLNDFFTTPIGASVLAFITAVIGGLFAFLWRRFRGNEEQATVAQSVPRPPVIVVVPPANPRQDEDLRQEYPPHRARRRPPHG